MAFTEIDEKLLVKAYQAGDERAFDTIVRTQYNALYAHALRRLSQHEAAEDAVQDTMLRAYRALPNLDGDLALRAWLHRILTNVCHDEGNRRRRQQGLVEKVAALPEEMAEDPIEEAVLHDTVRVMSEALKDLPESYREALVLRYVDGLSFREVAEATGVSEENARARVHRGRQALHKILSRLAVMAAFIIPGLRRTQATPADPATTPGVSEHAVQLSAQLTSHAINAAPTVTRLAEISTSMPSGTKSAIAAAAVTAVAAVSVPVVAHQVQENREPKASQVAAPTTTVPGRDDPIVVGGREVATSTSTSSSSSTSTSTTLPPSQANPFGLGTEVTSTTVPAKSETPSSTTTTSTTSTTVPPQESGPQLEGRLSSETITATGAAPQWDVAGAITLVVNGKSTSGSISGRLSVYADDTADSNGLVLTLGKKTYELKFRGNVVAKETASDRTTYTVAGEYRLQGAADLGLADLGAVDAVFGAGGESSSLSFELRGRARS